MLKSIGEEIERVRLDHTIAIILTWAIGSIYWYRHEVEWIYICVICGFATLILNLTGVAVAGNIYKYYLLVESMNTNEKLEK